MTTANVKESSGDKGEVWNRILRSALSLPGANVDRTTFLSKELSKHFPEDVVRIAIEKRPADAGIPKSAIRSIAKSCINWHRAGVSSVSFATGLPGGWWMAGTIPTDITQFFWHVIVIIQKLTYLYGWPSLLDKDQELDDETLLIFTIFVGVMFGSEAAGKALSTVAEKLAGQVIIRLPREALTKYAIYNLAKEVAKWIGVKLTKEGFARIIAKAIPIIGGFISGGVTFVSFTLMCRKLSNHLESLRLSEAS